MKIHNNFIYKLTDRLGTLAVIPLGEKGFTLDFERKNEDELSYEKKLSGKIMFVGEAFKRLKQMEDSIYRCDEQTLTVFKMCDGVEKMIFQGKISLNEAEFNLDKCEIVTKLLEDKTAQCISENKNVKVNLFQLIFDRITVINKSFNGTIETKNCSTSSPTYIAEDYWCGEGDPYLQNWTLVSYNVSSPDGIRYFVNNSWKREIFEIDCSEIADPNWVLIEDKCSTTGKKRFAQNVTLTNCVYDSRPEDGNGSFEYSKNCDVLGYDGKTTIIDNGLHFTNVMKELLKASCPDLILKSDFFQINPDNPSLINYVTGKTSTVNNIVIHQKSDVKRPNASSNATKLEIDLETMLEILKKAFNVKWRIEGNYFRLEHVSYYSKIVGTDVTSNELKKYFDGKRIYSYQSEKIPQKETFKFKEQANSNWGVEITYSGCVTNTKKNIVENIIDEMTTDIVFVMQNPDKDSKNVDDLGFTMTSTKKIGNDYFINSESSPSGRVLNNVFSFEFLIKDFHYYERPMKIGKVNGVTTQFITTIPTKKGEKFAIPLNVCNTNFNPDDFVMTALGQGIVSSAKYRFSDSFIELDLLYNANQDLTPNEPPILTGGGVYSTYKNVKKNIPITVSDPDGFVQQILINTPPNNGVVNIISFSEIEYVPKNDFIGLDFFSLIAKDNISESSNIANFAVKVLPENVPPIATDDEFFVWVGETFNQGISILQNDSDDYNSITLVSTNVTTSQGVSITINSNGFFDYVPPTNFVGDDSFDYSIKDDLNNISTATVILKVRNRNLPIAIDDFYQTQKNTNFATDGNLGKKSLLDNDYTPNGQHYTYTATAENKTTQHGGTVVINADGNFTYAPQNNFTGIDSFDYTVHNDNGSSVGKAYISVIPIIYVKMTTDDNNVFGHAGQDEYFKTKDYILNFFSDPNGNVPFDVSGLNFKVKIKELQQIDVNGTINTNTYIYETENLSGTSTKILDNFIYFQQTNTGTGFSSENTTVSIEQGTYNII